jgi:hypothetical protein
MEDSIMTIVVGLIAKPKGKRKPYFLIGSDTRGINLDNGNAFQVDNQVKIFPFHSMYLGLAGAVPNDIFEDLSKVIKDKDLNFDLACEWLKREVKIYLDNYPMIKGVGYWRIRMILGAVESSVPKMAIFEYDTRFLDEMTCNKLSLKDRGFEIQFIGDTSKTQNMQIQLKNRLSNSKGSLLESKKLITDFMHCTAEIYPRECNKLLEFKQIEGEFK